MIKVPPCFFRVSVKALITDQSGKFLLLEEPNGMRDLPGGGMEHHENHLECLKRELWEEMRLTPIEIATHPSYFLTFLNPKKVYLANIIYTVKLASLDFSKTDECVNIKFFSKEEVKSQSSLFYENVLKFVEIL